jgi:hypothetical protein
MHLLEQYSLSTASKIDKPYIYETFFPLPIEKYITFQAQSKFESKDYSYWQDVINIISPFLEKNNIKIIQFGKNEEKSYENVIDLKGKTSFNQLAFLMKNSLLHFGPDSLGVHIASMYDIPIVSLYSIIQSSVAGPYFGNKSKHILFDAYKRIGNGKPSYSHQENPKCINLIKPEEIADAIFKLLNIDFQTVFETVFTGQKYTGSSIQESLPNHKNIIFNPENLVEVRADLGFDEQSLINQLAQYKKCVLVLDKPINLNILNQFKQNILTIAFKITNQDNKEFLIKLRESGIKFVLISDLTQEEINKLKINYYQFANVDKIEKPSQEKIDELKKNINSLFYRSAKITASNDKFYYSLAAAEADIPMKNHFEYQKVLDTTSFWDNLDFFTIVKLKENT